MPKGKRPTSPAPGPGANGSRIDSAGDDGTGLGRVDNDNISSVISAVSVAGMEKENSSTSASAAGPNKKKKKCCDKMATDNSAAAATELEFIRHGLLGLLKCMNCKEHPISPVYDCGHSNNHYLCTFCYDRLTTTYGVNYKCPMDSGSRPATHFLPSPHAEAVMSLVKVVCKCANAESGCKQVIPSTEMKNHLQVCYFREVPCMQCYADGAPKSVSMKEYYNHYLTHCQNPSMPILDMMEFSYDLKDSGYHLIQRNIYDDQIFFFDIRSKGLNSDVRMAIRILGDEASAMKYCSRITVHSFLDPHATYSNTIAVIPFHAKLEGPTAELAPASASLKSFCTVNREMFLQLGALPLETNPASRGRRYRISTHISTVNA